MLATTTRNSPMRTPPLELLQRMPIFGAIADDALACLLEQARPLCVPRGQWFFREGDPAEEMYVLESGRALVLRHWRDRELLVRELGPGDCFGEMALIDLHARSAAVRAEQDCVALAFGPGDLLRLAERDPLQLALIHMNISRELSRRLRDTDDLLLRAVMGEALRAGDGAPLLRATPGARTATHADAPKNV